MKKLPLILLAFAFTFNSCSSNDDGNELTEDLPVDNSIDSSENNEDIDNNGMEIDDMQTIELVSGQISNLSANVATEERDPVTGQSTVTGEFTKFDFETGSITDSDTDWDIAFRATTIAINGGESISTTIDAPERNQNVEVAIADGSFGSITTTEGLDFSQDSADEYAIIPQSDMGWYTYNRETNVLSAIPGKVLVFKTRNGNFAKIEILSYYKDNPAEVTAEIAGADFRYYTFDYTFNPELGNTSFE